MDSASARIDLEQCGQYGWTTFRRFAAMLVGVHVVGLLGPPLVGVFFGLALGQHLPGSIVSAALTWVVELAALLGMVNVALRLRDEATASFDDFVGAVGALPTAYLACVLYAAVVVVGLALLVVPGLWLAVRLQFWPLVVVEGERNPVEALRRSLAITRGNAWRLLAFDAVAQIAVALGLLALGVGVFVACPVIVLAWADLYRQLTGGGGEPACATAAA